ncbi:hypothetical protein MiSe_77020 [Microseira wollei NIES-4236]|uniref:Uncharacterized protein n=1 Tax=Microseira wollei NIES-4236 TaxID=2530354 RepID=A0AAV3XQ53_9CYAN|nr:hypothetical protein MiSe_77020 [Microseira wollei NIES-4236]
MLDGHNLDNGLSIMLANLTEKLLLSNHTIQAKSVVIVVLLSKNLYQLARIFVNADAGVIETKTRR